MSMMSIRTATPQGPRGDPPRRGTRFRPAGGGRAGRCAGRQRRRRRSNWWRRKRARWSAISCSRGSIVDNGGKQFRRGGAGAARGRAVATMARASAARWSARRICGCKQAGENARRSCLASRPITAASATPAQRADRFDSDYQCEALQASGLGRRARDRPAGLCAGLQLRTRGLGRPMPRYRLDIEYDGTPYAGWQRQAGQHSVQAAIEQAMLAFCGEAVSLRGAGRTDAGVHATGQVAHVDLAKDWPDDKVRDAINAHLQHGRRSGRRSCRRARSPTISTRASRRPGGTISTASSTAARRRRWRRTGSGGCRSRSTPTAMHEAAQALVGRHDFTTFRSAQCQAKSPLRTLDRLDVTRDRRPHRDPRRRRARSCTTRCARWSAR